ncbi:MAG TPA: HlyD family efflux transporter periplasmic adaptor subunit [Puia sp.]|nr:HlyD family efflux transporter periplasmic adaptor subunit [Puia sp.]
MKNKSIICGLVLLVTASCKEKANIHDASGSFEAVETMISAEASGKILQLSVAEGQQLDSGQTVGYIDSSQLHLSRLQLRQNKVAILSGRPETNVQTEALKSELANAVINRDRTDKLVKGGVASQKQLDDQNAQIAILQSRINAQENSLQTSTSNLNEQGGSVDAQMKEINNELQKCVIMNPLKGTVLTKYAEPYEMATLGKPLYKIADLSTITLRAYITGDQLQQVKIDQPVKVFTDDGKGGYKETSGVITWINDKSEFTPKTIQTKNERANLVYAIKVSVKNDGYLKIGMYGEVAWNK